MAEAGRSDIGIRPRTVPELLDEGLRLYMSRFAPMFLIALVGGLVGWLPVLAGHPAPATALGHLPPVVQHLVGLRGNRQVPGWGALVGAMASLLAQAALIRFASDSVVRSDAGLPTGGEVLRRALRRAWPLLVVGLTMTVVAIIGAPFLLIPTVWLVTWWSVAPVVTVVEERRAMASLGRSRGLVGGFFWHTFGATFLGNIAQIVVGLALSSAGLLLSGIPGGAGPEVSGLWSTAARALIAPFMPCVLTLLYYDLRARKEGLDLLNGETREA